MPPPLADLVVGSNDPDIAAAVPTATAAVRAVPLYLHPVALALVGVLAVRVQARPTVVWVLQADEHTAPEWWHPPKGRAAEGSILHLLGSIHV
jgi:hypothetical protein